MSDNHCTRMEQHCLERARFEPRNRGKWIAQAERWHELARAQNSWQLQKTLFNSRCRQAQWQHSPMRPILPGNKANRLTLPPEE